MEKLLVDNHFCIDLDSGKILPKDKDADLLFVSHGHFDHIPTRFKGKTIICSSETKSVLETRVTSKSMEFGRDSRIRMLDAGHTIGSRMLFLKDHDLLYTGDFNTIKKYCGQAKPKRCETLIIESTYGRSRYAMPDYGETVKSFINYVKKEKDVVINIYSFGKAQEVCHLLEENKITFTIENQATDRINRALGLSYRFQRRSSSVILSDISFPGFKTIMLTGWVLDRIGLRPNLKGFPISDHADHPSLVDFAERCRPEKIHTFHGFVKDLAATLNRKGLNAAPLLAKQRLLGEF